MARPGRELWNRVVEGDALAVLSALPAESVQCCVTSPPYWGLRDYGNDGQIGAESSPGEYVERLVGVFTEVRRVLRDDGTLWLNLGDSYYGGSSGWNGGKNGRSALRGFDARPRVEKKHVSGRKTKDLVGIPWRVAFALQEAGWWLRSEIIWSKKNPMPENVTDRPTRSHEQIFLLSKGPTYFYDAEPLREAVSAWTRKRLRANVGRGMSVEESYSKVGVHPSGSNVRSVWTLSNEHFADAHFAVFPEEVPRRCILAGSRVGDVVLDPFVGSGTTCVVADAHQRKFLGVEINPTYAAMARDRVARKGAPLFSGVT